jgi:DNA-binding response OmpR family regulator
MSRILIIDDDVQILKILRKMLEYEGHEVVDAADGNKGLRLYQENPTELIIIDLIMSEKEGIETIIDLRREFPEVKIIAMSGGGHGEPDSYLHMAKGLGAQRTLTKPFGKEELLEAIGVFENKSCN